jgi:hypothetical protein
MQKLGRNPEHMKIQPACFVVVGEPSRRRKPSAPSSTAW